MRFFLDTEFMESPGSLELISVALVSENGSDYYAEADWGHHERANGWVRANVLPKLTGPVRSRRDMRADILRFVGAEVPEFWGYYADYDWVLFCWIFGAMVDLPQGWPMYCRDLKQWSDAIGAPRFRASKGEHHALADARWNQALYRHLSVIDETTDRGDG